MLLRVKLTRLEEVTKRYRKLTWRMNGPGSPTTLQHGREADSEGGWGSYPGGNSVDSGGAGGNGAPASGIINVHARVERARHNRGADGLPKNALTRPLATAGRRIRSPNRFEWERTHDSAKFLESFYFQYGHGSIADLGHLTMCFEGVSELAATEIVNDHPES